MTKWFGSLVGTPKQTIPMRPVDSAYENTKDQLMVRDTILLNAAAINDTISLLTCGWGSVLDFYGADISYDALGAATTLAIGDVTFPAALSAASASSAAGTKKIGSSVAINKYGQPLWQVLGYADLPTAKKVGPLCELLATLAGGVGNGNVTWQIRGARRGS